MSLLFRQGKLYLVFALIAWSISNLSLHILLMFTSIFKATLISHLIYICLAYFLYSKNVFSLRRYTYLIAIKFFLLNSLLWVVNLKGISLLNYLGINKNVSAFSLIPILTVSSFLIQKFFIFK